MVKTKKKSPAWKRPKLVRSHRVQVQFDPATLERVTALSSGVESLSQMIYTLTREALDAREK